MPNNTQFQNTGSVLWFSIQDGNYNPAALITSASVAGVKSALYDKVRSRGHKNAWKVSTQFGQGRKSKAMAWEDEAEYRTEYMPNLETVRVIVRASKNASEVEFTTQQVAAILLKGNGQINVGIHNDFRDAVTVEVYQEAMQIVSEIENEMQDLVSTMSAAGIRGMLRNWLLKNKCVPLKNGGGVYYLPFPVEVAKQQEQMEELESLIDWITSSPLNGEFCVLPLNQYTPPKTTQQIVKTSFDYIIGQFNHLNTMVKDYEAKGEAGKQIRPTKMTVIRGQIRDLVEQAELLNVKLSIDITGVLIGGGNLTSRLDRVVSIYGPEARKAQKMQGDKRAGTAQGRADGAVL